MNVRPFKTGSVVDPCLPFSTRVGVRVRVRVGVGFRARVRVRFGDRTRVRFRVRVGESVGDMVRAGDRVVGFGLTL